MDEQTMLIRSLLFVILGIIECRSEFENLKVEYYEKLIKRGMQDAASYKGRTDNGDFFQNMTDNSIYDYGRFDFIVVGGGSAGSVVSSRLTEVPNWKVLLLEAGGEEDDFSQIPGMHILLLESEKNWGYTTTRQTGGCFGMVNRQCPYPRGKVLGGSGAINGLVYTRGNRKNFDRWEQLGNPGWSYKDVLKYFKKSENSQIQDGDEGYHGFGGSLNNAYVVPVSPFLEVFEEAHKELGYRKLDYNGAQEVGVSQNQNNIRHGRRVSGGNSFVQPVRNRVNFNVTLRALVTKILINRNSRAYGVLFVMNGKTFKATASREVIISGGAINSPQLLMLSGIGPREELQKHNITKIQDLPVGQYMKDHITFSPLYFRTNYSEEVLPLRRLVEDFLKGRGIFTASSQSKSVSFINFNNFGSEVPDLGLTLNPPIGIKRVAPPGNFDKAVQSAFASFNPVTDFVLSPILLNPKSSGKIKLRSGNAKDFPDIDIGIFSEQGDLEKLYQGIQFAINLTKTKPFMKYNASVFLPLEPCQNYTFNTKDFWICAIRYLSFGVYHVSSTAKMGPPNDPLAVVNHELKVYGVERLRVVDCSIMPDIIAGYTNAAAFMIGEKAADMIRKYWDPFHHKTET